MLSYFIIIIIIQYLSFRILFKVRLRALIVCSTKISENTVTLRQCKEHMPRRILMKSFVDIHSRRSSVATPHKLGSTLYGLGGARAHAHIKDAIILSNNTIIIQKSQSILFFINDMYRTSINIAIIESLKLPILSLQSQHYTLPSELTANTQKQTENCSSFSKQTSCAKSPPPLNDKWTLEACS